MDNKVNALDRPIDHHARDSFYLGASLFSLVIVLVGFSPWLLPAGSFRIT